ncbi:IMP cyclohydrolase, partial [Anaerotignum sp.]|uniref:IMP cyclohydrolase n=1 Tax=Anaerotignum sp. TaxID=2039241 RepID=UPI0028A1073A
MDIYKINPMKDLVKENPYVGRGIVIGKTADGSKAAIAYFIMGRSENSRNRVFIENGEEVIIKPFDESKVEDPSLIIYSPIKKLDNKLIVTNGDQTDTIYDFMQGGKTFEEGLE